MRPSRWVLALLLTSPAHATLTDTDGNGLFEIYNATDLLSYAEDNSLCGTGCDGIELKNDIDLGGTANLNGNLIESCATPSSLEPIGNLSHNFNGNKFTISGICIESNGSAALFSEVNNANLTDIYFDGHIKADGNGALVAEKMTSSMLSNVVIEGSVVADNAAGLAVEGIDVDVANYKWIHLKSYVTGTSSAGSGFHYLENGGGYYRNYYPPVATGPSANLSAYAKNSQIFYVISEGFPTGSPTAALFAVADSASKTNYIIRRNNDSSLPVIATLDENPTPAASPLSLSASASSNTTEGSSLALTVTLSATATDDFTLTLSADDGRLASQSLSILADGSTTEYSFNIPTTDDQVSQGASTVALTLTPDSAGQSLGLSSQTVQFSLNDNDAISLSAPAISIVEGDSTTVELQLSGVPAQAVAYSAYSIAGLTIQPSTVSFADGQLTQTVSITAEDNATLDGSAVSELTWTPDAQAQSYGAMAIAQSITVADNDSGSLVGLVDANLAEGESTAMSLSLSHEPSSTIEFSVTAPGLAINPTTLRFDASNWQSGEALNLSSNDNQIAQPDSQSTVTLTPLGQATQLGFTTETTTISIADDDTVDIAAASAMTLDEGETQSIQLRLSREISAPMTFDIQGVGDISVGPSTLTFDSNSWDKPKLITVNAGDNAIAGDAQTASIEIKSNNWPSKSVTKTIAVDIADNDVLEPVLSMPTQLTEGESATATFKLNMAPANPVTFSIAAEGLETEARSVTLDQSNWDSGVTVAVNAPASDSIEALQTATLTLAATGDWAGLGATSTSVDIIDNLVLELSADYTAAMSEGETQTVTMTANAAPSEPVIIGLTYPSELSGPAQVTLTQDNWQSGATMEVAAADDDIAQGSRAQPISWRAQTALTTTTSEGSFDITLHNNDELSLSGFNLSDMQAGGTQSLSLQLTAAPETAITLTLSGAGFEASPAEIQIDQSNWDQVFNVEVTALPSDYLIADRTEERTLRLALGTMQTAEQTLTVSSGQPPIAPIAVASTLIYTPADINTTLASTADLQGATLSATGLPAGLSIVDGKLFGSVTDAEAGIYPVELLISDQYGVLQRQTVTLNLVPKADGSVAGLIEELEKAEQQSVSEIVQALTDSTHEADKFSDFDGDGTPDWVELAIGSDLKTADNKGTATASASVRINPETTPTPEMLGLESTASEVTWHPILKSGACADAIPATFAQDCEQVDLTDLPQGQTEVWWLAVDENGQWLLDEAGGIPVQHLKLLPTLSMPADQALEPSTTLQASLSGPALEDMVLTLRASGELASLIQVPDLSLRFAKGERLSQPIELTFDATTVKGSVSLTLPTTADDAAFVIGKDTTTLENLAASKLLPTVTSVWIEQNGAPMTDVIRGIASLEMTATSAWPVDALISWEGSDGNLMLADGTPLQANNSLQAVLDTSTLPLGSFHAQLKVTSVHSGAYRVVDWVVRISDRLASDSLARGAVFSDFDGDGLSDEKELMYDDDKDGIPNWMDPANTLANDLPLGNNHQRIRVASDHQVEVGYRQRLARVDSVVLSPSQWILSGAPLDASRDVVGAYDFIVRGLGVENETISTEAATIIIGLPNLNSENLAFNNLSDGKAVSDEQIKWAAPANGKCPALNSVMYTNQQTSETRCALISLADGDAHDLDGNVDGRIEARLALSVLADDGEVLVTNSRASGGGALGLLALIIAGSAIVLRVRAK
ncbi:MAG: hypothetical protein HWE20_14895 [Gammaproteobacteria bacterium]|nr:hypothetical protein [Gammaproteobacteria bacterium]